MSSLKLTRCIKNASRCTHNTTSTILAYCTWGSGNITSLHSTSLSLLSSSSPHKTSQSRCPRPSAPTRPPTTIHPKRLKSKWLEMATPSPSLWQMLEHQLPNLVSKMLGIVIDRQLNRLTPRPTSISLHSTRREPQISSTTSAWPSTKRRSIHRPSKTSKKLQMRSGAILSSGTIWDWACFTSTNRWSKTWIRGNSAPGAHSTRPMVAKIWASRRKAPLITWTGFSWPHKAIICRSYKPPLVSKKMSIWQDFRRCRQRLSRTWSHRRRTSPKLRSRDRRSLFKRRGSKLTCLKARCS